MDNSHMKMKYYKLKIKSIQGIPPDVRLEHDEVQSPEKAWCTGEDVAELEQSYRELLEALEAISNVYNEAIKPRTESMGMYYAAHIMVAIADKAIAKSKEKYNEL